MIIDKMFVQQSPLKVKDWTVSYNSIACARGTIVEIFDEGAYAFKSPCKNPVIFDVGANIGLATLFFKGLYPEARIWCFEADPQAYKMLQTNMVQNHIEDVHLLNLAVSDKCGEIDFFGQVSVDQPDARGNSIYRAWGEQRAINNHIKVMSDRLSNYITEPVDYLKLDVEGAEQAVLAELERSGKLQWVRELVMEVHVAEQIAHVNDLSAIINILERNGFKLEVLEQPVHDRLPKEIQGWVARLQPQLYRLRGVR